MSDPKAPEAPSASTESPIVFPVSGETGEFKVEARTPAEGKLPQSLEKAPVAIPAPAPAVAPVVFPVSGKVTVAAVKKKIIESPLTEAEKKTRLEDAEKLISEVFKQAHDEPFKQVSEQEQREKLLQLLQVNFLLDADFRKGLKAIINNINIGHCSPEGKKRICDAIDELGKCSMDEVEPLVSTVFKATKAIIDEAQEVRLEEAASKLLDDLYADISSGKLQPKLPQEPTVGKALEMISRNEAREWLVPLQQGETEFMRLSLRGAFKRKLGNEINSLESRGMISMLEAYRLREALKKDSYVGLNREINSTIRDRSALAAIQRVVSNLAVLVYCVSFSIASGYLLSKSGRKGAAEGISEAASLTWASLKKVFSSEEKLESKPSWVVSSKEKPELKPGPK